MTGLRECAHLQLENISNLNSTRDLTLNTLTQIILNMAGITAFRSTAFQHHLQNVSKL